MAAHTLCDARRACAAQVLSEPDVSKFVAAAHLLAAPGGIFFGSTAGADEAGEDRPGGVRVTVTTQCTLLESLAYPVHAE